MTAPLDVLAALDRSLGVSQDATCLLCAGASAICGEVVAAGYCAEGLCAPDLRDRLRDQIADFIIHDHSAQLTLILGGYS